MFINQHSTQQDCVHYHNLQTKDSISAAVTNFEVNLSYQKNEIIYTATTTPHLRLLEFPVLIYI